MPARARLLAVLTACGLLVTLPAVADSSTAPLHVPGAPTPAAHPAARSAGKSPAGSPLGHGSPVHRPLSPRAHAELAGVDAAGASSEANAATQAPSATDTPTSKASTPKATSKKSKAKKSKSKSHSKRSKSKSNAKKSKSKSKAKAKKSKSKAKSKKSKSKAKSKATIKARRSPGHVTVGHYIRSLRGGGRDIRAMRALGMRDAAANPANTRHLVLMDIGGQVHNGVHLSTTRHFVSYRSLVSAMNAYVDGYHARMRANAPVMIAIGTNNDLAVSTNEGRAWARQVVNPIRSHAQRYSLITIAGANDIEPGFRAGPAETRAWLNGYLASTTAPFLFNGSADGCSWTHAVSRCNSGWTSRDLIGFAGAIAPSRTIVLPQIYNHAMAGQWAQLARGATKSNHRLRIVGSLTENRACGRDPYCPTMPSWRAFRHLYAALRGVHQAPADMPYQVDLDVH